MSIKKYTEDLKMTLLFDERVSDFSVMQLRTIFNIIDEVYKLTIRKPDIDLQRIQQLVQKQKEDNNVENN